MSSLSMLAFEPLIGSEHALTNSAEDHGAIVSAEAMLWASAADRDLERLGWLLHHDFTGVTRDGERIGRDQLLEAAVRPPAAGRRVFTEWAFHSLSWPLVLVAYKLTDVSGTSQHMSVWDVSTGLARIRFHQGTWESVLGCE